MIIGKRHRGGDITNVSYCTQITSTQLDSYWMLYQKKYLAQQKIFNIYSTPENEV